MHFEMCHPDIPKTDRYIQVLDSRLRAEVATQRRIMMPRVLSVILHRLRALVKPLLQSGAMALTGIAVIIAISATPAANIGDGAGPLVGPLAAPNPDALVASDNQFIVGLPKNNVLAVQESDIFDKAVAYRGSVTGGILP